MKGAVALIISVMLLAKVVVVTLILGAVTGGALKSAETLSRYVAE